MDEKQAYFLNGLWTRHYGLGRIVRFRLVARGRQASCYEVLTSQQHEYLVHLFPAVFNDARFDIVAAAALLLYQEGYPVAKVMAATDQRPTAPGPQGGIMLVTENTVGQYLLPDEWSLHDMSQLGLRLAWLHRLMRQSFKPEPVEPLSHAVKAVMTSDKRLFASVVERLVETLQDFEAATLEHPYVLQWCHGDFQPAAILVDSDHQIRTITDFGLLHMGDPLEDLLDAFAHWCIGPDGVVKEDRGRMLLESYRTLEVFDVRRWPQVITRWCAQRICDFAAGRRILPRGFKTYLENPKGLVAALELCETR